MPVVLTALLRVVVLHCVSGERMPQGVAQGNDHQGPRDISKASVRSALRFAMSVRKKRQTNGHWALVGDFNLNEDQLRVVLKEDELAHGGNQAAVGTRAEGGALGYQHECVEIASRADLGESMRQQPQAATSARRPRGGGATFTSSLVS